MVNWTRLEKIIGETAREIGILVIVFAPLDAVFTPGALSNEQLRTIVLFAIGWIIAGIILETGE
jgi:hypothetical protein